MTAPIHDSKSPLVILVHGAFHGPWCWDLVVAGLAKVGIDTETPELPLVTLGGDVEVVQTSVRRAKGAGRTVLLVGHSYAGIVISAAGHFADHLVYVAAVVPDAGDSLGAIAPLASTADMAECMVFSDDGSQVTLNEHASPVFYDHCTAEQAANAMSRLRPQGVGTMSESIAEPAWQSVGASYVLSRFDRVVNVSYQESSGERLNSSVSLDADHSSFYSATDALVARLAELVRSID
jgi:hypothetical protein